MLLDVSAGRIAAGDTEIVERKGLGHPDTLCDAIAERVSVSLSRYYLEHFGAILHHNVDKALICAGSASPRFGGGELLEPIDIFLGGRVTADVKGVRVPVAELAVESTRQYLREQLPGLDVTRDVRIHVHIRPGSAELAALFQERAGMPRANDSSTGVGHAPLSSLENLVLDVEQRLNSEEFLALHPESGRDVKVMGYRHGSAHSLTVARAFVGRNVANLDDYLIGKLAVLSSVQGFADELGAPLACVVNAGDEPEAGAIYLTVTGTSAEAGDDGEVGRGNRANGLITPHRPMSIEAVAGKNPLNHTGKLYNVLAREIAQQLVAQLPGARGAVCFLLSQIGNPIDDPRLVQVVIDSEEPRGIPAQQQRVETVVREQLSSIPAMTRRIVAGEVSLY